MKQLLKKLTLAAIVLGLMMAFAVPADVTAQSVNDIREGVQRTGPSGTDVNVAIRAAINILSIVVGVIAVIMIIIGGLKYVTSNGDSNSISSAKNTIIYALIGIVVVALAQALVRFVLDKL